MVVTPESESSVKITWDAPPAAPEGYDVICLDPFLEEFTTETSAVIEGLPEPCTTYDFTVRAVYAEPPSYSTPASGDTGGGEK